MKLKIAVFSLGQLIGGNLSLTLTELSKLTGNQASPNDIKEWLLPKSDRPSPLSPLRKEPLNETLSGDSEAVKRLCDAFNEQFLVSQGLPGIDYERQFLPAFIKMSEITGEHLQRLQQTVTNLVDVNQRLEASGEAPIKILLLSHTNNVHVAYILKQIQTYDLNLLTHMTVIGAQNYQPDACIQLATSMAYQSEQHEIILEAANKHFQTRFERTQITSFLQNITEFSLSTLLKEQFPVLEYHYPGNDFRFFHQWLEENVHPISAMDAQQRKICMSLGGLLQQQPLVAVQAFETLIAPNYRLSIPLRTVLLTILQRESLPPSGLIERWKMGELSSQDFITQLLDIIQQQTTVKLTPEQFLKAWHTMNPSFDDIERVFIQAGLDMNQSLQRTEHMICFFSTTNPEDMHHLKEVLQKAEKSFVLQNGELSNIMGYPLYTSYVLRTTQKADMIRALLPARHSPTFQFAGGKPNTADYFYFTIDNQQSDPSYKQDLESIRRTGITVVSWDGLDITNKIDALTNTDVSLSL